MRRMEDCLDVVKQWITSNFLCMNDNKTDYLPEVPKTAAALVVDSVIRVGDATITVSRYVRNLGVVIDRHLDVKEQVSSIECAFNCQVSKCAFHLSNINQISRYLPPTTKERLANAIMTSLLDYCNSLLHVATANDIARLQRMYNSAARLILRSDSATPLLCILHWLAVARRIDFKLLVFTYRAVHGDKPKYMSERCDLPAITCELFRGLMSKLGTARLRSPRRHCGILCLMTITCRTLSLLSRHT